MLYKFVVSFSSVATSVDCYVRLCSPSDAMRPPTIQSLELEVERMKVCLVRDCHSVCQVVCVTMQCTQWTVITIRVQVNHSRAKTNWCVNDTPTFKW